ncbi:MAG TPA: VacB/RNase II family 3'-5' exoribonuclease [Acidobacteriaceae bacterium]|jgi:ribonuclease R|nr:VacB/RNase II family 3'-5' exoribonuclease [Acidobacteriaceae bacterium]
MNDRELLRHIERLPNARAGYKQLVRELGLGGGQERRELREQLGRLTGTRQLQQVDGDHWAIPKPPSSDSKPRSADPARRQEIRGENLVAGRLDLHRDGYGFVRPNPREAGGRAPIDEDVFIPPQEMNGAMQGDQVLVELAPPRRDRNDNRRSGRIVRILTRKNETVVGIFHYARRDADRGNYVVPSDERMTQVISIPHGLEIPSAEKAASPHRVLGIEAQAAKRRDNLEGLVVDVEITDWPTPTRPARGRVLEVLGAEDDFGVDVEMVIRKHHLPRIFPDAVLDEARAVAHLDPDLVAARRDFRDLPIVTIDGETARDFDDAVLVRRHDDGSWDLQVHIADVAEYVCPGTPLDLEARLRGTSVYFPDRAIPMLPQDLSTDICSLRPNEDRLVLSCLMRIDAQGEILGYEVCEGVIRSARRMTYTQVHAIVEGDAAARSEFAPLVPEFERMLELAQILNRKRDRRGSIDFDLPEPLIEFDEFGAMQSVTRSERNWAHRLIEEFMLSANECVASWLQNLGVPSLYRIHEKPEPRRVVEFEEIAAAFGYSLGIGSLPVKTFTMKGERREYHARQDRGQRGGRTPRSYEVAGDIPVTPRMYQKLTEKIAGKPEERILSYLMLRSLRQARYSEKNEGHFALAAPCYTHFTSPIRRYPDLIVHRITKALLEAGVDGEGVLAPGEPHAASGSRGQASGSRDQKVHAPFEPLDEQSLAAIGQESSENERRAQDAERELVEWKKIRFMRDRVGEDFSGMILNATKYGLFVELDDLFVEGLVPLHTLGALDNDRYNYRENTRQIIGDRWGRKFSVGERVRVVLDRVDAVEKRLQFSIVDGVEARPTPTAGVAPPAKSKKARREEKRSKAARKQTAAQATKTGKRGKYRPPKLNKLPKKKRE